MIALLLACSAPDDPAPAAPRTVASETTVTTPADLPWVTAGEAPAAVDLDALLETAQAGVEFARVLGPEPVLAAYRDLVAGSDARCPEMYEEGGLAYWLDSCTSTAGTRFDGYGIDDDVFVVDPYGDYDYAATGGAGSIEDPDGTFLEMDGYAQLIEAEEAGVFASSLILVGDFLTNHPAAAGTWLEQGLRPNVVATRYEVLGIPYAFGIVGAIDGLEGPFTAVAFDDAFLVDPALGYGGCALEPVGTVSVRLAAGDWVDVVFDPYFVGDEVVFDEGTCDGCGQAWHRDAPLGEACLDFSTW